jgi:hypothetical protein
MYFISRSIKNKAHSQTKELLLASNRAKLSNYSLAKPRNTSEFQIFPVPNLPNQLFRLTPLYQVEEMPFKKFANFCKKQ